MSIRGRSRHEPRVVNSATALSSATLPYLLRVAAHGVGGAVAADPVLAKGLSTLGGYLVYQPVAEALGLPFTDQEELLLVAA